MEKSKRYLIYKRNDLLCAITLLPKFDSALKQGFSKGEVVRNEIIAMEKALDILEKYRQHIQAGNEQGIKIVEEGVEYERQIVDSDSPDKKRLKLVIKVKKGDKNVQED